MNCKTCGKLTDNKSYCSKKCNNPLSYNYKTHKRCTLCMKYYPIIGDGVGQRCKIHGYLMRGCTRLTKKKDPNRWLKAY